MQSCKMTEPTCLTRLEGVHVTLEMQHCLEIHWILRPVGITGMSWGCTHREAVMCDVDGVICWQAAVKSLDVHFQIKARLVSSTKYWDVRD